MYYFHSNILATNDDILYEKILPRNHLNQKFKLMIEAPRYVIYSNKPPHTRVLWARSVDATQNLLIPSAKYSILNEGWLKFEPVTSCHIDF